MDKEISDKIIEAVAAEPKRRQLELNLGADFSRGILETGSTLHMYLRMLETEGKISQWTDGRYRIGPRPVIIQMELEYSQ